MRVPVYVAVGGGGGVCLIADVSHQMSAAAVVEHFEHMIKK